MFPKKQKTFHAPVPVCSGCKVVTEKSISCTKCRQLCCVTCVGLSGEVFNSYQEQVLVTLLANRTCLKCKTGSAQPLPVLGGKLNPPIEVGAPRSNSEPVVTVANDRGKCADHGKARKLFCVTCSQLLCGDCFGSGDDHARHIINYVDILYQEKLDEIERKLQQVTGEVRILEQEANVCRKNLAIIEERKQNVLGEVDRVSGHSKAEVERLTDNRITVLRGQIDRAEQRQRDVTALQGMVQQLHPEDFLKKCPDIRRQCDELLANSSTKGCIPAQTEDIGCELVPPFVLAPFKLANFSGNALWSLWLATKCDVLWDGRVQKGENITVQFWPRDPKFNDVKYEVQVVVPHPQDISKEVRTTFGQCKEKIIFSVDHCVQQGFIGGQNELTIKIGIRPTNALIGNKLVEKQYGTLKTKFSDVEKQLEAMKTTNNAQAVKINNVENQLLALQNSFDYKFQTMWFTTSMKAIYREMPLSYSVRDRDSRNWYLEVRQAFTYNTNESMVEAHVCLDAGPPTWCRYFVELEHQTDRTKSVRMSQTSWFVPPARFGWNNFISKKVLQADLGYRTSGKLNFCFGVQPLAAATAPTPGVVPQCPNIGIPVTNPGATMQ